MQKKNKKETAAAVKELIITELKESKQEREKSNLPMVVYDELKKSGTYEAPASYMSNQTTNGATPAYGGGEKDKTNVKKISTINGVLDSSTYKSDKDIRMIGGDGECHL